MFSMSTLFQDKKTSLCKYFELCLSKKTSFVTVRQKYILSTVIKKRRNTTKFDVGYQYSSVLKGTIAHFTNPNSYLAVVYHFPGIIPNRVDTVTSYKPDCIKQVYQSYIL